MNVQIRLLITNVIREHHIYGNSSLKGLECKVIFEKYHVDSKITSKEFLNHII
jgi:hypothetical protein